MKTIIQLLKELREVKGIFVVGSILYLMATAISQLSPMLLRRIIDGPLSQLDKGEQYQHQLLYQLGIYMLLVLVGACVTYVSRRILMHVGNRIAENMRNRAYDFMQSLPISYFDDKPAGKIATRIINDTETLRNQFYGSLMVLFFIMGSICFTYGIIFSLNPMLGAILLVLLPIFYGIQVLYRKLTDQPMKDFYEARSDINHQVNEVMNGVSILQLYGQEEQVLSTFEETALKMRQADNQNIWAMSIASWPLAEFLKHLVVAAVLTVFGYQFLGGQAGLSAGLLFVYLNYVIDLFDLLHGLVRQFPNIQRSLETGQRVLELWEEKPEPDSDKALKVSQGQVLFEDVSFAYEQGKPVLQEINMLAEPGQTIALVGHTGSGKSSIMNLLYRFYDPQKGRIEIDGQDIREYSRESLRSYMGIVLQDPYLFTGTIASNISMNQENVDDQEIIAALEQVGAGELISRLSKGIHEPVSEKGSTFSSGERQLIAFARTLFSNPKILILDEATSHIDTETEEVIQKAMDVVKQGRTSFIIAHRLSTIQHADQILVLDKGEIVERGTHQQLLDQNGLYAQMHKIQQKVG